MEIREIMDSQPREVIRIVEPETVTDGAGVRLQRSIASRALDYLDPFLLLDHFGSDNPDDDIAGFPMHPHRGIETVTYMLAGAVKHRDSLGNAGSIEAGDVQWMTAGGGILHEEMPERREGEMAGFQLWVNLPAKLKMTAPRYREFASGHIPQLEREDGTKIRVIAGCVDGIEGAITGIAADPTYLDVSLPAGGSFVQPVEKGHTVFAYLFQGEGLFGLDSDGTGDTVGQSTLVVFGDGNYVNIKAIEQPVRFLLVSGKPLCEPIVRYGPFVMNTMEEIEQALVDLRNGTFVQEL